MADLLRKGLTKEGHTAVGASDAAEGLALAMPKLTGYELAKRLRSEKIRSPILMLTAKDSVPNIVRGLESGSG